MEYTFAQLRDMDIFEASSIIAGMSDEQRINLRKSISIFESASIIEHNQKSKNQFDALVKKYCEHYPA